MDRPSRPSAGACHLPHHRRRGRRAAQQRVWHRRRQRRRQRPGRPARGLQRRPRPARPTRSSDGGNYGSRTPRPPSRSARASSSPGCACAEDCGRSRGRPRPKWLDTSGRQATSTLAPSERPLPDREPHRGSAAMATTTGIPRGVHPRVVDLDDKRAVVDLTLRREAAGLRARGAAVLLALPLGVASRPPSLRPVRRHRALTAAARFRRLRVCAAAAARGHGGSAAHRAGAAAPGPVPAPGGLDTVGPRRRCSALARRAYPRAWGDWPPPP